ncbi:hypothetical protein SAY86_011596 [Trapa natans]|uniref:AP2/ERF domain-containing protein n=1 Tax=Trapa natans TaxID=22666 RepID=A0AAN7LWS0_TRANT|nr:hypothetical protein SAY86_011596 [Trapa natans]
MGRMGSAFEEEAYLLALANPKKRAGRRKFKETRHPVYRGVRHRPGGRWVCELRNGKSRLWLGTYATPEMAARAHDVAALALRGRSACLNFADSAWRLPVPSSGSAADIRVAATAAAEALRSASGEGESSSSTSDQEQEVAISDAESSSGDTKVEEGSDWYLDEEAIFSLPELLVDMAEGLMVAPPPIVLGESWNHWDGHSDLSIWNYAAW